jgi:hypothetical protein
MYKIKEIHMRDALKAKLDCGTMIFDKTIAGGCSRRRPDVLIDNGGFPIIVECDENKHASYDTTCENKRLMELFLDLGSRPLTVIRFNPDAYRDESGVKHASCFKPTKNGSAIADQKEWDGRVKELVKMIVELSVSAPQKEVTILTLFY